MHPQLFTFPAFRSWAVTAFSFPQSHKQSQQVRPFRFSVLCITVRFPKRFPVRSSALLPLLAAGLGTHPQSAIVPRASCFVLARISPPQSQRHFHKTYPLLLLSVRSVTVSFPKRCPVRSFLFATLYTSPSADKTRLGKNYGSSPAATDHSLICIHFSLFRRLPSVSSAEHHYDCRDNGHKGRCHHDNRHHDR